MNGRLNLLVFMLALITACTGEKTRLTVTVQPTPPVTPWLTATKAPAPLPTQSPSVALVPQLIDDLAARLAISKDQIALEELRLLEWQSKSLGCPPSSPKTRLPLEYVMIVTENGTRYERPTQRPKLDKNTPMVVTLLVDQKTYVYYVIGNQFLFCPDGR
jgi:hypothetical protein